MGELFSQYNAGSPTDLFAPAYIRGFAPAEQAVNAWREQNRGMTPAMLEQTRMPSEYRPSNLLPAEGGGPYGAGRIPQYMMTGDPRGSLDGEALRVLAQGGSYDMGARRDAIAQRLSLNEQLRAQHAQPPRLGGSPFGDDFMGGDGGFFGG